MVRVTSVESQVERLANPTPLFRLFKYSDDKVATWKDHLLNDPLHVSDERRTDEHVSRMINDLLVGDGLNVTYEIGDFDGVLSFTNIVPGFKCGMALCLWNDKNFGPSMVKEAKRLIGFIAEEFDLKRISAQTADERVRKLARLFGFDMEGVLIGDFRWKGEPYNRFLMAITYPCGGE